MIMRRIRRKDSMPVGSVVFDHGPRDLDSGIERVGLSTLKASCWASVPYLWAATKVWL